MNEMSKSVWVVTGHENNCGDRGPGYVISVCSSEEKANELLDLLQYLDIEDKNYFMATEEYLDRLSINNGEWFLRGMKNAIRLRNEKLNEFERKFEGRE